MTFPKSKPPSGPLNLDLPEPAPTGAALERRAAPAHRSHPRLKGSDGLAGGVNLGLIEAGKSGQGGRIDEQF